ncbi:hypothetical protein N7507_003865 [Penicillium longicatenatum]|nr:hypothetical protein N7507_003865 [Penicillium longicatenatum]
MNQLAPREIAELAANSSRVSWRSGDLTGSCGPAVKALGFAGAETGNALGVAEAQMSQQGYDALEDSSSLFEIR